LYNANIKKNEKMKKIFLLLIMSTSIFVTSCDEWLDQSPVSTITTGSFWKTENDAKGVLNGMYLEVRGFTDFELYTWGECRSDMYGAATVGENYAKYYNNTINKSDPGPNWYNLYRTMNYANLLLKYVPVMTFTVENDKKSILAQAYTMRAWLYFVITRTWGDAVIVTEPMESYDPKSVMKTRSPKSEVFVRIKEDIEEALKLFPNSDFSTGRFRWNKIGALVLKADVYLWTAKTMNEGIADLQSALSALNEIKPASNLGLLSKFSDVFDYTKKGNNEVIMVSRFQAPPETSDNFYGVMYLNQVPNVTDDVKSIIGAVGTGNAGNSIMQIRKEIRDQFTTDDQRRDGTFYEVYLRDGSFLSAIAMKGRGYVDGGLRRFADDIVIYRYADVLLLKAEIKNALGQDPTAEISEIRNRAYGANVVNHFFVNGTKDENDAVILKERLLEFAAEGKRWWDLVRFDKVFDFAPSYIGKSKDPNVYLWPVGTAVISREPLIEENPGW
jgi:hypothetical protein